MGYEIVEGTIGEGRMREVRRVNYSPVQAVITRSGE